jgi:hypothetical protein
VGISQPSKYPNITLEDTTWLIKQNPPYQPKAPVIVLRRNRYNDEVEDREKRPARWQKTEAVITFHNKPLLQRLRGEKGTLQYSLTFDPGLWDQNGNIVTFTIQEKSPSGWFSNDDGTRYRYDYYRHELRYRGEIVGKQIQGTAVFVTTGEEWKWEAVLR